MSGDIIRFIIIFVGENACKSHADGCHSALGVQIENSRRVNLRVVLRRVRVDFRDAAMIFDSRSLDMRGRVTHISSHVRPHVWSFLATTSDLRYATVEVCWEFANKGQRTGAGRPTIA